MKSTSINIELPEFLLKKETEKVKQQKVVDIFSNTSQTKEYNYLNEPVMNAAAFKMTFANYNAYVTKVNKELNLYNREINTYNKDCKRLTDTKYKITEREHLLVKQFKDARFNCNKQLPLDFDYEAYNNDVENFNKMLGKYLVRKKKKPTLSMALYGCFNAIVRSQAGQLSFRNRMKREAGNTTVMAKNEIPEVSTNSSKLINATDEYGSRVYHQKTPRTVRNHVRRLIHYGILKKVFRGRKNDYSIIINPEILVIIDENPPKRQNTENKQVIDGLGKSFPHKDIPTRTKLNKEIKADAEKASNNLRRNKVSEVICLADGYKNTKGISKQIKNSPGPKISEKIVKNYTEPKKLAEKLANNQFSNYTVLRKDFFLKLVNDPRVTPEQMRQVAIQDVAKQANAIWYKHQFLNDYKHNATIGSYLLMLGRFNKTFCVTNGYLFSKEQILNKLLEYRWRIGYIKACFSKKSYQNFYAQYPNNFFDPTRNNSKDVCFAYTKHNFLQHQYRKKIAEERTEKEKIAAKQRKEHRRLETLFMKAIKKYINGHLTFSNLLNYVAKNLNNNYLEALPTRLEEYRNQIQKVA